MKGGKVSEFCFLSIFLHLFSLYICVHMPWCTHRSQRSACRSQSSSSENPRYKARVVRFGSMHLHLSSHLSVLSFLYMLQEHHVHYIYWLPGSHIIALTLDAFVSLPRLQLFLSTLLQISTLDRGRRRLSSLSSDT